jgi:E3 ubiquitin-protein ligase HUWE1
LKAGGIDTLLRFYSLPTLPYDLANSSAFFTLSHLLKLLSEANPAAAISAVVKEVNRILQQVQPLLDSTNAGSDLVQYIDIAGKNHVTFVCHYHDFLVGPGSV